MHSIDQTHHEDYADADPDDYEDEEENEEEAFWKEEEHFFSTTVQIQPPSISALDRKNKFVGVYPFPFFLRYHIILPSLPTTLVTSTTLDRYVSGSETEGDEDSEGRDKFGYSPAYGHTQLVRSVSRYSTDSGTDYGADTDDGYPQDEGIVSFQLFSKTP